MTFVRNPARIVSVCIRGVAAKRVVQNSRRLSLITAMAEKLSGAAAFDRLDAILFPAGFLRLGYSIGDLVGQSRMRRLDASRIGPVARRACSVLQPTSPGVLIAIGIDSRARVDWEQGDQCLAAWDRHGVVGLARKIFPTMYDSCEARRPMVPRLADYGAAERFVDLPSGHRAALACCYDLYGTADRHRHTRRFAALQLIATNDELRELGDTGFEEWRDQALTAWETCLELEMPTVALAAIHGFRQPGREGMWQRHAIAAAAARLRGLAVGAAHYRSRLPFPNRGTLAAYKVTRRHLRQGPYRRSHPLLPTASLSLSLVGFDVLIRLFQGSR